MIFVSGTITNAVKMMEMETRWQQKKNQGEPLSKKERNERANWTEEQRMIANFQEELEQNRESKKMQGIMNKVAAGQELTNDEISYLKQKNPQGLKAYEEIRAEKEGYKRQLENCKTKEEVDRLKMVKMGEFAASVKKAEGNSCIPKGAKLAIAQKALGEAKVVEELHQEFIRSGQYEALPSEEELREEKQGATDQEICERQQEPEAVAEESIEKAEAAEAEALPEDENKTVQEDDRTKEAVRASLQSNKLVEATERKPKEAVSYEAVKQMVVECIKRIDLEGHRGRRINQRI